MSAERLPGNAEYIQGAEFEPAAYLDNVRENLRKRHAELRRSAPPALGAQMYYEQGQSLEYVVEAMDQMVPAPSEQEKGWIGTNYAENMMRIVKATARANEAGSSITPFHKLDDTEKQAVRHRFFEEYIQLASLFAMKGKPSKTHYAIIPILYHSPSEAEAIISQNSDLGRGTVSRLITQYPTNPKPIIDEVRAKIAGAIQKYPTIPPNEIRRIVASTKNSYEQTLARYAEKHGLSLQPAASPDALPPTEFLGAVRSLLREKAYDFGHLNPSPDTLLTAEELGKEAIQQMVDLDPLAEESPDAAEHKLLMDGFGKKIELMVTASHRAWRKGDMPLSLDQAPPAYRREVYLHVLAEYVGLIATLGGTISGLSVKINPVLYFSNREVESLVDENEDLAATYLRPLIMRNPKNPEKAISDYRLMVASLMANDPRLLRHQAMRIALDHPLQPMPKSREASLPPPPPREFINAIRTYLNDGGGRLGTTLARDIQYEIEARRPEFQKLFEDSDWTFGDFQIPREGRARLLEKVEDFITANERGFRKRQLDGRIRDYDAADRQRFYLAVAEDYVSIVRALSISNTSDWLKVPVLYTDSARLATLRTEYSWMSDNLFRRTVLTSVSDIAGGLERARHRLARPKS